MHMGCWLGWDTGRAAQADGGPHVISAVQADQHVRASVLYTLRGFRPALGGWWTPSAWLRAAGGVLDRSSHSQSTQLG